jgi:dolichyl-phosphate-mannose--protein O-mannosyl transferase
MLGVFLVACACFFISKLFMKETVFNKTARKALLLSLLVMVILTVFYCLFPKYTFYESYGRIHRHNRITGTVEERKYGPDSSWIKLK